MKDINGYEGLYAITSCGKVWSYRSKKFLSNRYDSSGYCTVILCKNGERKQFKVHRLVAEAYIPNPNNLAEVDHINGNKTMNCINNLQWLTKENNIKKAKNKKVYCFETDKIYDSGVEAAKELGLTKSLVSRVCNGTRNHTHGYHFEFVKE